MRRIRQLFTAGLLTVIMVVTAACGGQEFDASGYVQAFMDMMTKGEVENYMEITGQSEEEAKKDYTAMTDAMMEALNGGGFWIQGDLAGVTKIAILP
jgi:acyl-CoA-binding protein